MKLHEDTNSFRVLQIVQRLQLYIQSVYAMPTDGKAEAELRPFTLTRDSFPKIVVRKDIGKRWYDDNGILNINVIDFLLDKELI